MAVIFDPKNKDKNQAQPTQFGTPTGGSASTPAAQPASPQGTSSGRFTNIQNYLKANNQAGKNLAQNIGGQLEQKGAGIRQELGQAQQQFQQKSQEGRLDATKALPEAQQIVSRAGSGPFENDVQRFQRISSGQYQGPQELAGSANLQARGQEIESLGKNLGTSAGRTQVLGQLYGGQGYTGGQRRLDDLLISQNTNALQKARGLASGLGRTVENQANAARGMAGYFGQEAAQVGSAANKALSDAQAADEAALAQKQQETFANEQANIAKLKKEAAALGSGNISKELVDKYGLSNLVGQSFDPQGNRFYEGFEAAAYDPYRQAQNIGKDEILTYGFDPNKLFKVNESTDQITRESVASKEQAARLNALAKLGNMSPVIDESKAGTFKGSSIELNPEFLAQREAEQENIRNMINQARNLGNTFSAQAVNQRNAGEVNQFYNLTDQIAKALGRKIKVV